LLSSAAAANRLVGAMDNAASRACRRRLPTPASLLLFDVCQLPPV
jgi:hypothetical protein